MGLKQLTSILLFALILMACKAKLSSEEIANAKIPNNKNIVNWEGRYEGILPCEDCEGIHTIVDLYPNNAYHIEQRFINKNKTVKNDGVFDWIKNGNGIALNTTQNKLQFILKEDNYIELDTSAYASDEKRLYKTTFLPENHYWIWKSAPEKLDKNQFQIHLKSNNNGFNGKMFCNQIFGAYTIDEDTIDFFDIAYTEMDCGENQMENEFIAYLNRAKYYVMINKDLVLLDENKRELTKFTIYPDLDELHFERD